MAFNKFFNKTRLISDVNGKPWNEVVEAFRQRLIGWWFEPFTDWPKTGHEAFPVLLSMCAVLSTLAGASGEITDSPASWDKVLENIGLGKQHVRQFRYAFLYLAAHGKLPDEIGMSGTGALVVETDNALVVDPWVLRDRLREYVDVFCAALLADDNSRHASLFKLYLNEYFGIKVGEQAR